MTKSTSAMTNPCRMPKTTGPESDLSASMATHCCLLYSKFLIQSKVLFLIAIKLKFQQYPVVSDFVTGLADVHYDDMHLLTVCRGVNTVCDAFTQL